MLATLFLAVAPKTNGLLCVGMHMESVFVHGECNGIYVLFVNCVSRSNSYLI